jgi:hypothetical protein
MAAAVKPAEDVRRPSNQSPWGIQEEKLLAKWADKAACYRWLHDESEKKYSRLNMILTIPVIVLSTLTGTANFGLASMVPTNVQNLAQVGIGGVTLFTGIVSTVANYLRYAQRMEAHRGAAISWGKLYRKISVELALARHLRESCMEFLLVCRSELDRLTEQSPTIPDDVVVMFKSSFPSVELTDSIVWNDMIKTEAHPASKGDQLAQVVEQAAEAFNKNMKLSQLKKTSIWTRLSPRSSSQEPKPAPLEVPVDLPVAEEV